MSTNKHIIAVVPPEDFFAGSYLSEGSVRKIGPEPEGGLLTVLLCGGGVCFGGGGGGASSAGLQALKIVDCGVRGALHTMHEV